MAVPWLQIVQLVPSILEVSRELLKRSKRLPAQPAVSAENPADLVARVASLEENERRQAELVSKMAEQLAALARAVTVLHRRAQWLAAIAMTALVLAILAVTWR